MLSTDLTQAVGRLLQADPARIVALISSLRGPDRVIESTVEGMSMGRCLPPGSRIRIELANRACHDAGTIIAFLVGKKVVVHRVVHRGRGGPAGGLVLTRGDAPLVPDPPVAHAQILGPVTGVWTGDRWTEPCGVARRSFRATIVSSFLLLVATGLLYLSPRTTSTMLALLHRAERAMRIARTRNVRQREPIPPAAG